jgi:hypothetical protein
MLAGVMDYKKGAASPYHLHKNWEHFYFTIESKAQVESGYILKNSINAPNTLVIRTFASIEDT